MRDAHFHIVPPLVHVCVWRPTQTTTSCLCPHCSPFAHTCVWPSVCQVTFLIQAQVGGSIPQSLLNTRIKSTLSNVLSLQDKFARNGKVVDGQVRAALDSFGVPAEDELTPEQVILYRQSRALEEGADPSAPPGDPTCGSVRGSVRGCVRGSVRGSSSRRRKAAGASLRMALGLSSKESTWFDLTSSPFVTMGMQYKPTEAGQQPIILAEAQTVVDCGMEEAYFWFMMAVGRERTRRHLEHGDLACVQLKERSVHDRTVATIRKTSFRLTNREYVVRSFGVMKGGFAPCFNIALTSEEVGKVDYGQSFRVIRGHLTGLVVILSSPGKNTCKITFTVLWSGEGNLPPWAMRTEIMRTLSVVNELRTEVQRDDEIDAAERAKLVKVMTNDRVQNTPMEIATLNLRIDYFKALGDAKFQEVDAPDPFVKMEWALDDGESVLRASTTVDATVEDCAAFETAKMSRSQQQRHFEEDGMERSLVMVNAHSSMFRVVRPLDFPGAQPREWLVRYVWKWKDEKKEEMALSYETLDNDEAYPANPSYGKVSFSSMWVFKRLKEVGRVDQTLVTVAMRVNLGGFIPQSAVRGLGVQQLNGVCFMRQQFDKSLDVDGEVRAQNVGLIADHADEYSEEENILLEEGENHFADFKEMKVKSLEMASPLTRAEIAFEKNDSHAWGRATTTVRASPKEVLAFLWDTMRRSARRVDDLEKSVDERVNGHNMLVYNKKRGPKIISDRDFLGRYVWKKEGDGFVFVTRPEESEMRVRRHSRVGGALSGLSPASSESHEKRVVRGKYLSATRIKRKNDKETNLEYVVQIDLGGSLPAWLTNLYVGSSAATVTEVQEYFQALRGLEEWDAYDAKAVGEVLCIKTEAEKHPDKGEDKQSARMRELFKKYLGLSEISRKYEFFQPMMARAVRITLKPVGDVKSKLCVVSAKEGRKIGEGLAMALANNLTAEAGVDEWILKYSRSLGELDRTEAWFRPMLNTVAKRLLGEVSWGLKMRVTMGAGLSMLDMTTDIFVIVGYIGEDETKGYGYSLLWMVVAGMVLLLLSVVGQNWKKPQVMAKEMLIVMTGLKPAVDCGRVCAGREMEEHHTFDVKTELVITKAAEMVCESIPGCVLQLYVLFKNKDLLSKSTVGSVIVSAMTTGFSSASISFE